MEPLVTRAGEIIPRRETDTWRRTVRVLLTSVFLSIGALPGPARSGEPSIENPTSPAIDVTYKNGRLTVQAEEAELKLLLERIAEAMGGTLEIGEAPPAGRVSLVFTRVPLDDIGYWVTRMLETAGARDYVAELIWSGIGHNKLMKMSIVKRQARPAETDATKLARREFRSPESVRSWLTDRYGVEYWNIGWPVWNPNAKHFSYLVVLLPGLVAPGSVEAARKQADSLLPQFIELLEVPLEQLKVSETEIGECCFDLYYQHEIDSIPALRSRAMVRFRRDKPEVMVANDLLYGIDIPTKPTVSAEEAARIAVSKCMQNAEKSRREMYEAQGPLQQAPPRLVIYGHPMQKIPYDPYDLRFHLAWEVRLMDASYFIDAADGFMVNYEEEFFPRPIDCP
jgi:hypothetical protein